MQRLIILLTLLALTAPIAQAATLPQDDSKALIIGFNRIGEDAFPDKNITNDQFDTLLREVIHNDYTIRPLPELLQALKSNSPLPQKTIAIILTQAHRSALTQAIPKLLSHNIPFTLFINPQKTDIASAISRQDIQSLQKHKGVSFGVTIENELNDPQIAARRLNQARMEFKNMTGNEAKLFAADIKTRNTLSAVLPAQGFDATLIAGKNIAHSGTDFSRLTYLPVTENNAHAADLRRIASALPIPVSDIEPQDYTFKAAAAPLIGFTVDPALIDDLKDMRCKADYAAALSINTLGNRVELRFTKPPAEDTAQITCDISTPQQPQRIFGISLSAIPDTSNLRPDAPQ